MQKFTDPCSSSDIQVQTVTNYYVINVIFTASTSNSLSQTESKSSFGSLNF